MLRWRLVAAAAIIIPLIGILLADFFLNGGIPGIWLVPLGLVIALMATAEVLDMLKGTGNRPIAWTAYAGVALIYLSVCVPVFWKLSGTEYPPNCPIGKLGWPFIAAAVAVMLAFIGEMRRFEQAGGIMVNLSLSVLTVVYVGIPMAFAVLLRTHHSNAWGMSALVSMIFIVKMSDTGAYFTGKNLGKRKLAPKLSPGKTVEGGIGGIVVAIIAAWIFFELIAPWMTGTAAPRAFLKEAVYGLVLAITGMLGDLSESLMKRDVNRKDSSSWLPGLGGVLDIMDSMFFALPAAYLSWCTGLVGPG